jgi:hypothetical protein
MMDNILDVVPYEAEHGRYILSNQMNHPLMDEDAKFDGDAMNLEQKGLAYTCMINNEPIAAAGMKMIWNGVAEGWVIATNKIWDHPLLVAKAIKLAKENNIKRVQTAVRQDYDTGIKFAEWLGLENEGLMRNFGFDGSHQYRYARIF